MRSNLARKARSSRRQFQLGHAGVASDKLTVATDERDLGERVGPVNNAHVRVVETFCSDGLQDMAAGPIVAQSPDVAGVDAEPMGVDGDIERLAAGEHHPQVPIAIDDVVTHAGEVHG